MKSEDMKLRLSMHRNLRVFGIIALLIVLVVETATAAYPTATDVNIQGSIWRWVPVKIVPAGGAGYSDYYPEYRLNADTGTFMMDTPFNSVAYVEKYFDLPSDGSSLSLTVWGVRNIDGWCGDPVKVTVSLIDYNRLVAN